MTIGEFLKQSLEHAYLGKTIRCQYGERTFVVSHVEVCDGGVDPQWEIALTSALHEQMDAESREWQKANNPLGGVLAPQDLEDRWRVGWAESYYMTFADHQLPQIIEQPAVKICIEDDESELDLANCEQCGEAAWDGRICHACGMKEI
jgi:hypothetical protein